MSKRLLFIGIPILLLVIFYVLGPSPEKPVWDTTLPRVPQTPDNLEEYIAAKEAQHQIKPDNESRIIWYDSSRRKTPYSVVYLHGFSASYKEGDPVHGDFANRYGCNLYLPRLADHGIDTTEQLMLFTADREWESAKEALQIGKAIGEKVIIISTSTGGTLALMLASEYPEDVFAMINMSPNLAINDPFAWLLNNPWGLQIARMVRGENYNTISYSIPRQAYWNGQYRLEAAVQLQEMLEDKMNDDTFERVKQPVLTLYYYKNEEEQDPVVKVSAMLKMYEKLGTPKHLKKAVAIPTAGAHVMGSYLVSEDLEAVEAEINRFAQDVLLLPVLPKKNVSFGIQ